MRKDNITCQEVRKLLHYDAKRGIWTWKVSLTRSVKCGAVAGHVRPDGYRLIGINGDHYLSSRLAFLYIKGYFPENEVDHINRNPSDDRWCNLREVSAQCNTRNCGRRSNNTSGITGVHWHKQTETWHAWIVIDRNQYHLGAFNDFTEAVAHRLAGEQCFNWSGCDSNSPAYQYMQNYLRRTNG